MLVEGVVERGQCLQEPAMPVTDAWIDCVIGVDELGPLIDEIEQHGLIARMIHRVVNCPDRLDVLV
jgi:hypothetical protein